MEDRLLQTEQNLINVKEKWAESEHEKEILRAKFQ